MAPPEENGRKEAGAAVGERRWAAEKKACALQARDEELEAEIAETKARLKELLARRNRADLAVSSGLRALFEVGDQLLGPEPENDPLGVIEEASDALAAEEENTDGNIGKPVSSVAAAAAGGGKKQRSKTRRPVGSRPFKRTGKTKKDRRAQTPDGRS